MPALSGVSAPDLSGWPLDPSPGAGAEVDLSLVGCVSHLEHTTVEHVEAGPLAEGLLATVQKHHDLGHGRTLTRGPDPKAAVAAAPLDLSWPDDGASFWRSATPVDPRSRRREGACFFSTRWCRVTLAVKNASLPSKSLQFGADSAEGLHDRVHARREKNDGGGRESRQPLKEPLPDRCG
jgi:hypothetical protein